MGPLSGGKNAVGGDTTKGGVVTPREKKSRARLIVAALGGMLGLVPVAGTAIPATAQAVAATATPATAQAGSLAYGVAVPPEQEVMLPPAPYEPSKHGRALGNTQPSANVAGRPNVSLPQRAGVVHAAGVAASGVALPVDPPGSGDSGLWISSNTSAGIYAQNDAQTDLVIPAEAVGTTIYAPTHMAAGNSCIETVTAHWYYAGMGGTAHGHGFWDWCAVDGSGGWQVFELMDSAWLAKYVRKQNGEGRYWTQVYKEGACWRGLLYNFSLGKWEEKTTICGTGPFAGGWTMWESHYLMDQAQLCPNLPNIRASKLQVFAASGWARLTKENSSRLGPYGLCWQNNAYQFHVAGKLDEWQADTR
jgi:hypothetical protein